jgi:hypothetical protein
MYYNHNLRTDLQEWKNRLYRASYNQLPNQLQYFFDNLKNSPILHGILKEACIKYEYTNEQLNEISEQLDYGNRMKFENEAQQVAFNYQFLLSLIDEFGYDLHNLTTFQRRDFSETRETIIEDYLGPIINYFHDSLDKSSSTIYLLEKYKKRTEWFMKNQLYSTYKLADKNYEQLLEDDLRLFLFDQGIDYPFSTPKSTSGRADIVGSIDTSDPLIIEIKILDKEKKYGLNRIKEGLSQIIKYTNDYNKDFGYLIIFNLDELEVDFQLNQDNKIFPPRLVVNNKSYFFVTVNLKPLESASKQGKTETMVITEKDLIN